MCWFFFFKQKTAYELRISDWSSDVCSSDLAPTVVATNPPADAQIALPQPFLSITFDQDMFVAAAGQAGSVLNPAYYSLVGAATGERAARSVTYDAQTRTAYVSFGNLSADDRSEEHTSELQSLMRISYAVFCLQKNKNNHSITLQQPIRVYT